MYPLKQSTAITVPFFVHDVAGDAVTGLVDAGFTKRISKNGVAFAAMTVTITEMENGWYSIPLSTAHSDTVGLLSILFTHASAKQINLQLRVHARVPDDLAFPSVSGRNFVVETDGMIHGDLKEWLGTAPLALIAQRVAANAAVVGDKTGYTLTVADKDDIVDRAWDEAVSGHVGAGSTGNLVERLDLIATGGAGGLTNARAILLDNLDALISSRAVAGDAMALTAAAINLFWNELTSEGRTAGSYGQLFKDNIDAILSVIKAETDKIALVNAGAGVTGSLIEEIENRAIPGDAMDLIADAVDSVSITEAAVAAAVWDALRASFQAADSFGESYLPIVKGAAVAGTLSTTEMTTDLVEVTNGHFTGRTVVWVSGALSGASEAQGTDITGYLGADKRLQFTAVTDTPVIGDKFLII